MKKVRIEKMTLVSPLKKVIQNQTEVRRVELLLQLSLFGRRTDCVRLLSSSAFSSPKAQAREPHKSHACGSDP